MSPHDKRSVGGGLDPDIIPLFRRVSSEVRAALIMHQFARFLYLVEAAAWMAWLEQRSLGFDVTTTIAVCRLHDFAFERYVTNFR